MPVTFNTDDLSTPDRLERVLRQFEAVIDEIGNRPAPEIPDIEPVTLAVKIAPEIRRQLQAPGAAPLNLQSLLPETGLGTVLQGTHNTRLTNFPADDSDVGSLFWETDRTVLYLLEEDAGVKSWGYIAGVMRGTLSPDTKPTDLGTADTEFIFRSTDFEHDYRWSGSVWDYASYDEGSGYIRLFLQAPRAGVWQLLDGSAGVTESLANGTTQSTAFSGLAAGTVPNVATAAYLKIDTAEAANPAAASGTVSSENSHTHDIDHDHPSTASGTPSATETVDNDGGGSTVAVGSGTHTHTTDLPNFTGTSGAGSAHDHGPNDLELRRSTWEAYYRL